MALRLQIQSWRWMGVPFYIRAGKCLRSLAPRVLVRLRPPPTLFSAGTIQPNHYRFRISPQVVIALGTMVKAIGEAEVGRAVELLAGYDPHGVEMDAYERLLGDAMKGDATQFAREDSVEQAWRIVDPALGTVVPVHE